MRKHSVEGVHRLPDPLGIYCFLRDTGIIYTSNHKVLRVRETEDSRIGAEPPASVARVDPSNQLWSGGGSFKRGVMGVPCTEIGFVATSNSPSAARGRKACRPVATRLDRVTVIHGFQTALSILASAMMYLYDLG